jgi:hypothetical protein
LLTQSCSPLLLPSSSLLSRDVSSSSVAPGNCYTCECVVGLHALQSLRHLAELIHSLSHCVQLYVNTTKPTLYCIRQHVQSLILCLIIMRLFFMSSLYTYCIHKL